MTDVFGFLQGVSPWWWVALAIGLIAIEMLTFSFFLIWPGLAAVVVAVILWIVPDLSGNLQVMLYAIISLVLTLAGRAWVQGREPVSASGLNERSSQMIGRRALVIDGFDRSDLGNVEVDGIRWRARMEPGAEPPRSGATLRITGAEGMTLILSP